MVGRAVRAARRTAVGAARGRAVVRRGRSHLPRRVPRARRADRRHRGRPAGGAVRPGLLRRGRVEVHLRHRVVRAGEHRRPTLERSDAGLLTTVAWMSPGGRADLRPGGRDLRHRGGRAVAARRPRADRRGGGDRGAGRDRARQRRRGVRARADRARRPRLGPARPAAPSSASPAARPGRTWCARRSTRSPSRCATSSSCCRASPRCASTAAPPRTACCCQLQADTLGMAGRAARGAGDDRARCGLPRRPGHRRLVVDRRAARRPGGSTGASSRAAPTRTPATRRTAAGGPASSAPRAGTSASRCAGGGLGPSGWAAEACARGCGAMTPPRTHRSPGSAGAQPSPDRSPAMPRRLPDAGSWSGWRLRSRSGRSAAQLAGRPCAAT